MWSVILYIPRVAQLLAYHGRLLWSKWVVTHRPPRVIEDLHSPYLLYIPSVAQLLAYHGRLLCSKRVVTHRPPGVVVEDLHSPLPFPCPSTQTNGNLHRHCIKNTKFCHFSFQHMMTAPLNQTKDFEIKHLLGLNFKNTVYQEFFASGYFGENDAWKVC